MGRPSKYKPEYCQALIDFYDVEPYEDRELEHFGKDGKVKWVDYKRMANRLPTLRNFAKQINIGISTLYDWMDEDHSSYHKEFSDTYTRAKELLKWFLIENGLNGCYNPAFAIFTAKNITDMRDVQEQDINLKVQNVIELPPERKPERNLETSPGETEGSPNKE